MKQNTLKRGRPRKLCGHDPADRFSSGGCRACARERYQADPEKFRRQASAWAKANPERFKELGASWRQRNPERWAGILKKSYLENLPARKAYEKKRRLRDAEKRKAYQATYQQVNRERLNILARSRVAANQRKTSRRRARKQAALCDCCTPAAFAEIFRFAAAVRCHVDHITPLAAGGMHCLRNLQVLTPEQHREKTKQDLKVIAQYKRNLTE